MTHQFGTGALIDTPDDRDFQWQEIGFAAAPFNWGVGYDVEVELTNKLGIPGFTIPVKDQNGSGSCGGQAWSYYDASFEAMATGTYEERSAKYIYAQTFIAPAGSYGRDNANILSSQGCAQESVLTSYDNGNPPGEAFMQRRQDITTEARNDAKKARAKGYANVSQDIDTIAQAIRENYGVVIGLVGQNNGTWLSVFPKAPDIGAEHWYHWLYAGKAALINGKKHIGVINSWGKDVGQGGWQWISEDYLKTILPGDPYGKAIFGVWTQVFDPASLEPGFQHKFTQQMDFGAIGAEVIALQIALKQEGCFPSYVPATGLFGLITQRAVKKFQAKYGIVSSGTPATTGYGRVGPKTIAQLNKLFS